jgi:predicted enzyme related to lactoylglutathione lyase
MKFNNIRLLVTDFDKAFKFYNDTLGLECTWGQPGDNYASFNFGIESGLAIFKRELMSMAIPGWDNPNSKKHQDNAVIIVEVENVSDTYKKLIRKGVAFLNEPTDVPAWGIRVAHFRDTEENLFEIYSALS